MSDNEEPLYEETMTAILQMAEVAVPEQLGILLVIVTPNRSGRSPYSLLTSTNCNDTQRSLLIKELHEHYPLKPETETESKK